MVERFLTRIGCYCRCPYCDFSTATPYTVKIHIRRRHSEAKPHVCDDCGLTFKMRSELTKHVRVHGGAWVRETGSEGNGW